ncbi:unnamed protein product [Sphagnum jensenii]
MTLDKTGLSEKAHAVIKSLKGPQHFDDGGSVAPASDSVQDSPEQIAVDATATPPLQGEQMGPPIPQTDGAIPVQAPSDDIAGQKAMTTNSALNEEKDVMGKIGDIQAGEGAAESGAIQQGLNKANGLKSQNDLLNEYNQKGDALMQSYANKSIDPDRYYKNMSTGSKVAAGIGMLLSGFGAGASHQQNLAAQTIQGAVDRDISAQQNDQSKAMNLYKMNQEQYGNASAALAATQNQIYTGIKYKLMQAEANAKGPLAKQQAQLGMAQIDQKIDVARTKGEGYLPSSLQTTAQDLSQRIEQHPIASTVGGILGGAGALLATGGLTGALPAGAELLQEIIGRTSEPMPEQAGVQPTSIDELIQKDKDLGSFAPGMNEPAIKQNVIDAANRVPLSEPLNPVQVDALGDINKYRDYKIMLEGDNDAAKAFRNLELRQKLELTNKTDSAIDSLALEKK